MQLILICRSCEIANFTQVNFRIFIASNFIILYISHILFKWTTDDQCYHSELLVSCKCHDFFMFFSSYLLISSFNQSIWFLSDPSSFLFLSKKDCNEKTCSFFSQIVTTCVFSLSSGVFLELYPNASSKWSSELHTIELSSLSFGTFVWTFGHLGMLSFSFLFSSGGFLSFSNFHNFCNRVFRDYVMRITDRCTVSANSNFTVGTTNTVDNQLTVINSDWWIWSRNDPTFPINSILVADIKCGI